MLLSHLGEYLANMDVWNSRWISPKVAICTNGLPNAYANRWRITVFTTFAECTEALRIAPLTEWRMFLRTWIFEFRVEWRPKWRLDSDYFYLGLTHRSSSFGPLLTNILRIYYACQCLYERCKRLLTLYQRYQCFRRHTAYISPVNLSALSSFLAEANDLNVARAFLLTCLS